MDGAGQDAWSAVASEWAELWGDFARPARRAIEESTAIREGSRVLDVGCGSGEFLRALTDLGAVPAGVDPAPAMVDLARSRVPGAEVRLGAIEALPWPDGSFDVVTAINAVQFADDQAAALAEMARVAVPGGFVAVANWADASRNDIHVIEQAIAASFDEELPRDDELRLPGGLERLFRACDLRVVASGTVPALWEVPDENSLVRGILLGEDAEGLVAGSGTVLSAAKRFRMPGGGYRLENAFRFAVGRTPSGA